MHISRLFCERPARRHPSATMIGGFYTLNVKHWGALLSEIVIREELPSFVNYFVLLTSALLMFKMGDALFFVNMMAKLHF